MRTQVGLGTIVVSRHAREVEGEVIGIQALGPRNPGGRDLEEFTVEWENGQVSAVDSRDVLLTGDLRLRPA